MKKLENKTLTIPKPKEENKEQEYFKYSDFIMIACGFVDPQNGCMLPEQRVRCKIMDVCESGNGELEFDEKHVTILKKVVNECPFNFIHKDLSAMSEDIEKL